MKRPFAAIAISLSLMSFAFAQSGEINIIPKPVSVERKSGVFILDNNTRIVVEHRQDRHLAELLVSRIKSDFGVDLKISPRAGGKPAIFISRPDDYFLLNDGYLIVNDGKLINIEANSSAGRFYGVQSLLQMIRKDGYRTTVPNANVNDSARFRYRGMHLDVSRHFQPVEFLKKFIDQMAQFKFNTFHWHLTDDQGWRIEIKKYPKLTTVGQYRSESHEGNYSPIFKGDGRPVEGFYTQDQIKEVIAYAKARYITVIPEIELPGHASAALAAYPELGKGCAAPDYKFEVKKTWGIFKEVFCPTEETFKFLEDVLDETIKLFPDSPYIHIGGDEVLKDFWKESAFVQELKKRENLKDEHEVQSYFVRRIEKFINSRGKKIIGWDEILEGGIAPNATIMSWRGMKGGIEAAKAKHDVIMTPTDHAYLDYGQGDPSTELLNIGGYLPLEKVYAFEPVPPELSAEDAKYILGGQGNIWTEYIETGDKVEYMAFPRMLAMAEAVWSQKENRNYKDFYERMLATLPRLDKQGVNFRIPEPIDVGGFLLNETEAYAFEVRPPFPGAKVYYTKDGSTPTEKSPEAPQKISVFPVGDEVVTIKTIVVLPSGRKSTVYAATFMRGKMMEPVAVTDPKPGIKFELCVPNDNPEIKSACRLGDTRSILLNQFAQNTDLKKNFGVQFDGYFKVPADGVYELQIESTWDTTLLIGGKKLIDEAGTAENHKRSVLVPLKAGLHPISLRYNHRGGDSNFRLRWGLKGQGLRQAYGGEFVH